MLTKKFFKTKDETEVTFEFNQSDVTTAELVADFKNGFLDGRFIHYSASFKKIREFGFLGGEKHGLATHYYPDERLSSKTPWYQGMRDGNVLRYSKDLNQTITTYSYKEGKIYEISK